jgi:MoaA/NifB/PqqE/SkfB family radical SAM enzyme
MTATDWRSVIDQAAALGVSMVQFIGGEPTLHPDFSGLLRYAIDAGLAVEVYTNLTHVKDSWWEMFACHNVSLATSYYSDMPAEHERIANRQGSHAKTRANITEAIRRGVELRAGIIGVDDGQRIDQARAELEALGVRTITTDYLRRVGRGARAQEPGTSQLCGNCGREVAAVSPDGDVWPCVFARWMTVGNVRTTPLAEILAGSAMISAVAAIPDRRHQSQGFTMHDPGHRDCSPDGGACTPAADGQCGPSKQA